MYLCSARFIVNITHQHDNNRTLQAIYCYACYLVGLLVIMQEPHETGHGLATPELEAYSNRTQPPVQDTSQIICKIDFQN